MAEESELVGVEPNEEVGKEIYIQLDEDFFSKHKVEKDFKGSLRVKVGPNELRQATAKDSKDPNFFIAYGDYILYEINDFRAKVKAVAQKRGDAIMELGLSDGPICSFHLKSLTLFEGLLDKLAETLKPMPSVREASVAACPLLRLRSSSWTMISCFLLPHNTTGVFTFDFDAGLLGLMGSSTSLLRIVSMNPMWITQVLGLDHRHVGAVLARKVLSCERVAQHICLNAARLPDVIRKDPYFRNILMPETRHSVDKKQENLEEDSSSELPPKFRAVQLLGTFLLNEPSYRGDVSKDPISAELQALCQKIAKEDPLFVLKLARYTRHTLTFRNTTNFILALAVQTDSCRPMVRTALPHCTNLPTDLLELWDYHRTLTSSLGLPACLKKGMKDKVREFGEYQLGKYLNAKVPKPPAPSSNSTSGGKGKGKGKDKGKGKGKGKYFEFEGKGKGKGKGKFEGEGEGEENDKEKKEPETGNVMDPLKRPLTIKALIRATHAGEGQHDAICGVLRKRYPVNEEQFQMMNLSGTFDPDRSGMKLRIPVPKTWETELSEKGNTAEVWQDLIKSKSIPFMAMLRNLRNILLAGVDESSHRQIMSRLKSETQLANSKQGPIRFLSAFEAIDFNSETLEQMAQEAKSEEDYIETEKAYGSGKDAKKVTKRRKVNRNPVTKELLDKYRAALEQAVTHSAQHNVPMLECPTGGKVVVLVDVSGSMDCPLTQGPKKLHQSAMEPHRRSNGRPIVEGQDMCLEDYFAQAGQRLSKKVSVSMTWIGQDLDLSVACLDKDGKNLQSVSYSQLHYTGVKHSGDITKAPNGAEEVISVDLDELPKDVFCLTFTVNSYSGQPFDQLEEAAISLRDDGLKGNSVEGTQEICAFRLAGSHRAVIACSLLRKPTGWSFRCLNTAQESGRTIESLSSKIAKEFEATIADAATNGKRLVDASMLLALCLRQRLGDEKCEVTLFSSAPSTGGSGHIVLRSLGPGVLANIRRCHAAAGTLGRGTEIPISYLQELASSGERLDHLVFLTDGLVEPAKDHSHSLSRWLRFYRQSVQPVKFTCIDVLGLGKPKLAEGGSADDVLVSGYSEAVLRYLAQDANAQLAEIEAFEFPPCKKLKTENEPAAEKDKPEGTDP